MLTFIYEMMIAGAAITAAQGPFSMKNYLQSCMNGRDNLSTVNRYYRMIIT
jgi:hypothetical protein